MSNVNKFNFRERLKYWIKILLLSFSIFMIGIFLYNASSAMVSTILRAQASSSCCFWDRDVGLGYLYTSNLTDRVGIGTSNPAARLHLSKTPYPNGIVSKIDTDEPIYGTYNIAQSSVTFPGSIRKNEVLTFGWNTTILGQENPAEPSIGMSIENFYSPAPGSEYSELILFYTDLPFGVRPLQFSVNRNTHITDLGFQANVCRFYNVAGDNWLQITSANRAITFYDTLANQSMSLMDTGTNNARILFQNYGAIDCDLFLLRNKAGAITFISTQNGKMSFPNLSAYANNAAAIAGGLVAGNVYRTGGDPDTVCVVH